MTDPPSLTARTNSAIWPGSPVPSNRTRRVASPSALLTLSPQVLAVNHHQVGARTAHLLGGLVAAHHAQGLDAGTLGQPYQAVPHRAIGQVEADPIARLHRDEVVEQGISSGWNPQHRQLQYVDIGANGGMTFQSGDNGGRGPGPISERRRQDERGAR